MGYNRGLNIKIIELHIMVEIEYTEEYQKNSAEFLETLSFYGIEAERAPIYINQLIGAITTKVHITRPRLENAYTICPYNATIYEFEGSRYLQIDTRFNLLPEYVYDAIEGISILFPLNGWGRVDLDTNEIETQVDWEELYIEVNEEK